MARYTLNQDTTNFATAAAWDTATNTPSFHATTNIGATTGGVYTATFTAPNTTNACTGVWLYGSSNAIAGRNIIVTLQENTVNTVCTKTVATTDLSIAGTPPGFVYIRFPTPYVFTSTTAGYYRFEIKTSASTWNFAAISTGATIAYMATDDRHSAPGADQVFIPSFNGTDPKTLTLSGTQTIGDGTAVAAYTVPRQDWNMAICVGNGGIVAQDPTATTALTIAGFVVVENFGQFGSSTAMTAGQTFTITMTMTAAGSGGFIVITAAKCYLKGTPKTYFKTTYVSGDGTTATPLVTTDTTGWAVNDEIVILASSDSATNYAERERKFIKTISGTSITLSDTAGGAEVALSYTHFAGTYILNIQREVILKTSNAVYYSYFYTIAHTGYADYVVVNWARFINFGNTSTNYFYIADLVKVDNSVIEGCNRYSSFYGGSNKDTYSNNIYLDLMTTNTSAGAYINCKSKTFNDCFYVGSQISLMYIADAMGNTFNRCVFNANGSTGLGMAMTISGGNNNIFNDCEISCIRAATTTGAIHLINSIGNTFNNCEIGTMGKNGTNIFTATTTYNTAYFNNCLLDEAATYNIYNTTLQISNSRLYFQTYNQTNNKHFVYATEGVYQSTGATLDDTNVRTAGTFNLRLAPNTTDGLVYEYQILAKASSAVSALGFIQKNAAFGTDIATVELFLPSSTTADSTYTMPNDTAYNVFLVYANYTGTVNGLATVRITAKTATSNAYIYVADLFNGTNDITNLKTWYNALPSQIMYEQLGDAAAVWGVASATQTTAGTMGKAAVKSNSIIGWLRSLL